MQIKRIYEGGTGCGKTYTAIQEAKKYRTFIYFAPCRQLVYETALKYGDINSTIHTGEVHITGNEQQIFAVYESFESLKHINVNSIIIDEAHFLQDEERGAVLQRIIELAEYKDIDIYLLTATRNFRIPKGYELIKLKSLCKFRKKRINIDTFYDRLNSGEPSIIFRKYKGDVGCSGGVPITADTPCDIRLQNQLDFTKGKIKLIECTNVLAQGLNFPATNILIESNEWDNNEVILQKLGRLGRYGITDKSQLLTYCVSEKPGKVYKNNIEIKQQYTNNTFRYLMRNLLLNYKFKNIKVLLKKLRYLADHELYIGGLDKYNIKSVELMLEGGINILSQEEIDYFVEIQKSRENLKKIILNELSK